MCGIQSGARVELAVRTTAPAILWLFPYAIHLSPCASGNGDGEVITSRHCRLRMVKGGHYEKNRTGVFVRRPERVWLPCPCSPLIFTGATEEDSSLVALRF